MSKIKSLILGSAAVIAASAGAQAADLPVKAKAVQYVKICSLYGAGFYYIPGTDTCIKLGGYTQFDVNINGGNYNRPGFDNGFGLGTGSRDKDMYTTRARNQFNIDTRTATEYGVVRTFWSSNFEFSTGAGPSTGNLTVDYGFVQFAGFTLGKAISGFQTPWGAYGANNNTSSLLGGYDNATGISQIAYTWQFGNGISAQLGVEDNRTINRGQIVNASLTYAPGTALAGLPPGAAAATSNASAAALLATGVYPNQYGGNTVPDITANIRVDQAAFTLQASGALHQNHATYYSGSGAVGSTGSAATLLETAGHPSDKFGGAASVGLQLKNLPTGPGDKLSIDGTFGLGATKYLISGTTGSAFDIFGSPAQNTSYQSFTANSVIDSVYTNGGSLELTTSWGFRGAYVHNWSPTWESSVFGSYTKVDYNANASAALCANQVRAISGLTSTGGVTATIGANYTCDPDFAIWQVGSRTAWTPVRNLTFSGEVLYTAIDQKNTGSIAAVPNGALGTFKPAGNYDFKDQGTVSGNLRVRRTW